MLDLQQETSPRFKLLTGNAGGMLDLITKNSVDVCFTSPEPPFNHFEMMALVADMIKVMDVMKQTGSIWIELADYHNTDGDMTLIPERFLYWMVIENGWHLRSKLIWKRTDHHIKDYDMPDKTRFKRDWEYLFWFVKNNPGYYLNDKALLKQYYFNSSVIEAECPDMPPKQFATNFPMPLIVTALDLTCPDNGLVLDPYSGTATTGVVALNRQARYIGIDSNEELQEKAHKRLSEI